MIEFSLKGYEELLNLALKNNYHFKKFDSHKSNDSEKIILLRHDIDADLEAANRMSKVEFDLGVRSTYFIMLRSPVYNLFSRHNAKFVEQIIMNKHYIGLHYDEGYYPNSYDFNDLHELIKREVDVINTIFDVKISSISFHQPSATLIRNSLKFDGLMNTYSKDIFDNFYYISDSNKVWKNFSPDHYFESNVFRKIQLLIHPMWWVNGSQENIKTDVIWNATLLKNFKLTEKQLLETERAYGIERNFHIG